MPNSWLGVEFGSSADRADDRYRRNLVIPMGRDEGLLSTYPRR